MRFMIIVKANKASEAGDQPRQEIFTAMADYHEELAKAGALVDCNGLQPTSRGFRVQYADGKRSLIDGPFAETKELVAGYTIIDVKSKEEAMDWAVRFPNPHMEDCYIEVRRMYELEDLLEDFPELDGLDRFHQLKVGVEK